MSKGKFVVKKYESDSTLIHPIKLQEETVAALIGTTANEEPTAAQSSDISVSVSSSRRAIGLHPRTITIQFDTPPTGYRGLTVTIPVLKKAAWTSAARGGAAKYLETDGIIVAKAGEVAK